MATWLGGGAEALLCPEHLDVALASRKLACLSTVLFFFPPFYGCICGIWKFPGYGSSWSLRHSHDEPWIRATSTTYTAAYSNAGSLTP